MARLPLLRYDGNTGSGYVLVFAGLGGYKTTGTVVPSALEWQSGLVCLDPLAEVVRLAYKARRALSHRVVALNPKIPTQFLQRARLDQYLHRSCPVDLQSVVGWLCGETLGEYYDDYFKHAARALLGYLLADLVFDPAIPDRPQNAPPLRCGRCIYRFM